MKDWKESHRIGGGGLESGQEHKSVQHAMIMERIPTAERTDIFLGRSALFKKDGLQHMRMNRWTDGSGRRADRMADQGVNNGTDGDKRRWRWTGKELASARPGFITLVENLL